MLRPAIVLALAALLTASCQESSSTTGGSGGSSTTTTSSSAPAPAGGAAVNNGGVVSTTTTASGIKIEELTLGTGAVATRGRQVTVHYTGWLTDGTKFDSSVGGQPLVFVIGANSMIQGMEEGVTGMKVGGKRRITIPPALGYGERGNGPVPPNATTVFECEMMDVK